MPHLTVEQANEIALNAINDAWFKFKKELSTRNLDKHAIRMGNIPNLTWRSIRGTVAGLYFRGDIPHPKTRFIGKPHRWDDHIEMNIRYLYIEDAKEFITSVALHELGHCINFRLNNRYNHDGQFRAIMRTIGGDPSTYHSFGSAPLQSEINKMMKNS